MKGLRARMAGAVATPRLAAAVVPATDAKRARRIELMGELSDPEALRAQGRDIRARTVQDLDRYLAQLADRLEARGTRVFWAKDAGEASAYVTRLARERGVSLAVKSKSMLTEEIELNAALQAQGVEVVETDLGEFIVQLAGERPSHIIMPAMHLRRGEIRALFQRVAGRELPDDPEALAAFARAHLRERFLTAGMGISGVNFAVAETGTLVMVTNEGNGRMVTSLPPLHVAVMGMERVVPTLADLDVLLRLLVPSASGQRITTYVSLMNGPRQPGEADGPREQHLVIVDGRRSALLGTRYQEALHCIRCGACMNVCPVYRRTGGHAYGGVYAGPIGAVLSPLFQPERFSDLAQASSLCGACSEACPVMIPLDELLVHLREDQPRKPVTERLGLRVLLHLARHPHRWARALALARRLVPRLRPGRGPGRVEPLAGWLLARDLPPATGPTFRERWEHRA